MASILECAAKVLNTIEKFVAKSIYFRLPPDGFAPALIGYPHHEQSIYTQKSLTELLQESILWAVPKKRRSVEKRRTRKYGHSKYGFKIHLPKSNILICDDCGSYREAGKLCPSCYGKIKQETELAQEAIQQKLGISCVESEVVLQYLDDKEHFESNPEFFKGKRIVEIPRNRPKLFSDNLLQKSTQGPATTGEVIEKKEVS